MGSFFWSIVSLEPAKDVLVQFGKEVKVKESLAAAEIQDKNDLGFKNISY